MNNLEAKLFTMEHSQYIRDTWGEIVVAAGYTPETRTKLDLGELLLLAGTLMREADRQSSIKDFQKWTGCVVDTDYAAFYRSKDAEWLSELRKRIHFMPSGVRPVTV